MNKSLQKIVCIGAGNLATHLCKALYDKGYQILQVYSRTEHSARQLGETVSATYTTSLDKLRNDVTLYIVSLKDSAFAELLPDIVRGRENAFFIHTSGSIPMNIWKGYVDNYGVLYPMQTFSKSKEVDFRKIPLFLEANNKEGWDILREMANDLSELIYEISSEQRRYLHLAAVFACNFSNHMYALAADILRQHGLPFEIMLPLIDETASKVHELSPADAQTGPAIRYDENVINNHLELLSSQPEKRMLYEEISKSIHGMSDNK